MAPEYTIGRCARPARPPQLPATPEPRDHARRAAGQTSTPGNRRTAGAPGHTREATPMSSTATIRGYVELDLRDTGNADWSDAQLNRHIERAVREYSHLNPLEVKSALTTNSNSRVVAISTLVPRIGIVAAEYPTGEYPPSFVPFSKWADEITLDLAGTPSGTPAVNVYWHKEHTLHATVDANSTFPTTDDELIATGAAAYAALEMAIEISNKVNVGGDEAWGKFKALGDLRLKQFQEMLANHPAASRIKTSRLYTPIDARLRSQTTDPGPV
jgi:hypothetical protein